MTLAAQGGRIYFNDGEAVVALDRQTGKDLWRSAPLPRPRAYPSQFAPTLVAAGDVVLYAGGETAGLKNRSWYTEGEDTITALSAATGETLWKGCHPPSGYASPEDVFVVDGVVWCGNTTSGRSDGLIIGRDARTGEVKSQFTPDVDTYWFHHRCYRGRATVNYLLTSRTGIEFIDFRKQHWVPNHWVRGACLYGVMPANGLIYAPPHPCACYLESKLSGFNALAPESSGPRVRPGLAEARLDKGPAFGTIRNPKSEIRDAEDWPTYRHDAARSGATPAAVPADLSPAWQADLGGRLSSVTVADGKVFVAQTDAHTVRALDAASGRPAWHFTAGGRVDSPPTVESGSVIFGAADGWVYALRAADGALSWRFRAAPAEARLTAFEQVESPWPVHGSVLVRGGEVWCVAGRSMFLDGGLRLVRLEAATGRLLSETVLDDRDPASPGRNPATPGRSPPGDARGLQAYVSWLNMPPALPDILSSDGSLVYMRSQAFDLKGERLPLEKMASGPDADRGAPPAVQVPARAHLFSPTGFLDDAWWHRTYWMYGSTFVSGWCGYFLAGKAAPAGRILVFDSSGVYGYGRKPQYWRWTTPKEDQLFAATKDWSGAASSPTARRGAPAGDRYRWTQDVPILARAMVLAGGTLFVAGPPDLLDEEQGVKPRADGGVPQAVADQAASLEGRKGARLLAFAAGDGQKLAECPLVFMPVLDGLAAAGGCLYLATADGRVLCLAGR
jgi:outer membrane protein assembly factor BamB